jgi:hypothetical protein
MEAPNAAPKLAPVATLFMHRLSIAGVMKTKGRSGT